ncbi:hypothetical protein [Micromonospora sp. WMMD714]|uniref:hypothetical protein n=1 Tax=Micromonospora sp. WMMD714 TaxID=3016097 RepID=UPI00249BEBEA|nr:hypothetical protein [Micromonospora sp. WMMD714]WFE65535.1 hypothetical protein O7625_20560 [Micromonospora sp. WMMD714]
MRFGLRRNRLDHQECAALIAAATTLCAAAHIAWKLDRVATDPGFVTLSERLQEDRRQGRTFVLPGTARSWFPLRYADPDAALALALVLLWAFGTGPVHGHGSDRLDHVDIALWHLRVLLPPTAHGALPAVAAAYAAHRASLPAVAGADDGVSRR